MSDRTYPEGEPREVEGLVLECDPERRFIRFELELRDGAFDDLLRYAGGDVEAIGPTLVRLAIHGAAAKDALAMLTGEG